MEDVSINKIPVSVLGRCSNGVSAVAVTPDGLRALSASYDGTLKIWDLWDGKESYTLTGHRKGVSAVEVTPDGNQAVSASWDCRLRVWDLEHGVEMSTLKGHTDRVLVMSITPDGTKVVSTSADKTLRVWDLRTGRLLGCFQTDSELFDCAITPDEDYVLTGDRLGKVYFCQLEKLV